MQIELFLDNLYDEYWQELGSVNTISKHINNIKNFDNKDFLKKLINIKYDTGFILSNFLFNSALWVNLNKSDWDDIIKGVDRSGDSKFLIEEFGAYYDLVFLYKFLKVNSVLMIYESDIDKEAKLKIFRELDELKKLMFMDESDLQSFIDGTFPNYSEYSKVSGKLIAQGCLPAKPSLLQLENDLKCYLTPQSGVGL